MRQAEQRIFRCDRFRRNGVQSGSGDLAAAQGFGKGGAGHKVAAGSVDDECTVLHARQKTCVHHVHGLRCDRQMQAEDIAAFLYRFKSCIFRMAGFLGGAVGPERVIYSTFGPKGASICTTVRAMAPKPTKPTLQSPSSRMQPVAMQCFCCSSCLPSATSVYDPEQNDLRFVY